MSFFKGLFARIAKHKKHYWDFVKMTLILSCLMFGGVHLFMALIGSTGIYTFWMAFRIAVIMTGIDLIINIRVDNEVEERMVKIAEQKKFDDAIAERFRYNNQTIKTDSIDEELEPELNENDNTRRV